MSHSPTQGTDAGYAFLGPAIPKKIQKLQTGLTLGAYQRTGVVVTENAGPWCHATFLIQETVVTDTEGKLVLEAALCETVDPDGDLTWCTLWLKAGSPARLLLIAGTGKWEGISGQGEMAGFVANRADDWVMPRWMMNWQIDREKNRPPDSPIEEARYANHDCGFRLCPRITWTLYDMLALIPVACRGKPICRIQSFERFIPAPVQFVNSIPIAKWPSSIERSIVSWRV